MIPKRWVEAYLRFLLRNRLAVTVVIALMTVFFSYQCTRIRVIPQFLDFYPSESKITVFGREFTIRKGHPYINIYNEFRRMFGSANVLTVILEVKTGDVFNPTTLQKLDQATKWIVETRGVVPYQILSIAHAKMKSINISGGGAIQIREVFYPNVPQTQADADRVKFAVYATKGIRGLYVAEDDTAALIHAGFWEEELDFHYLYDRMMDLKRVIEDDNHTVYVTGFPWLYTSVQRYSPEVAQVFVITVAALSFLLWNYFRTWTGIWVPIFSGILSGIWALGLVPLLGLNLDPLILVVPIFLSARALSHSVQSMDRYHEEYHRTHDRHTAIVESYSHLFPPAIASILNDAAGILLVTLAPIPLIQKVAIFSCFWIFSILVSVVTLHPIILSVIAPPGVPGRHSPWTRRLGHATLGLGAALFGAVAVWAAHDLLSTTGVVVMGLIAAVLYRWHEQIYKGITDAIVAASAGWRRWAGIGLTIVLFIVCPWYGRNLKVGDMTPGAALLFPDHPYNVAYAKLNEKFLGASQLVVIADTGKPDGMKDVAPLTAMEELADHMEAVDGAGASVTVVDIVKQLSRLFHEGEPKWAFVPDRKKFIAELFYQFTQSGQAGDLDRFLSTDARYGTVLTLFHGYSHDIIMNAIQQGQQWAAEQKDGSVRFLFAGGLFGVLAAVNEAVEDSYWTTLSLVMVGVAFFLYITYGTVVGTIILMIPVLMAQVATEAFMYLMRIDLNVNSLPVAAVGAGVGVDYGIYHFSRMIDLVDEGLGLEDAVDGATATTGKAIIFTASTMIAGAIFWWFSDLKFQAEMGFLLALLMAFNTFGGLVLVPAWIKVVRPRFLVNRRRPAREQEPVRLAVG
jgi:hypothetical protein